MENEEKVEVKVVEEATPEPTSKQDKEAAALNQAVESGEVAPEYGLQEDGVYKINVDKPPVPKKETQSESVKEVKEEPKSKENAIQERKTEEISVDELPGDSQKVEQNVREQDSKEEKETVENKEKVLESSDSPLELITEDTSEPAKKEKVETPVQKQENIQEETPKQELPENVDKLVKFMEETGGTVEDYINLNRDMSKYDNTTLLREYYKTSKPHLDSEDIDFLLNKNFGYDKEGDDPSEIKAKQLAFKEELFNAQNFFKNNKEKYYADLKLRKSQDIAPEYKEAMDYYNNHKQLTEEGEKLQKDFLSKTDKVFSDEFKGFDFKVGENKYRFKIDNPSKIKEFQSDIKNFANLYMDDKGTINDPSGYHKALFAGRNADKIANHFYEQGRADAIKESAKKANNINMEPRSDNSQVMTKGGQKIRVVSGESSDKLRIKWK
tara:strand:- start:1415 stop:2734 length:1320 start_codon:yes stop_codon:yes gene_type:complete